MTLLTVKSVLIQWHSIKPSGLDIPVSNYMSIIQQSLISNAKKMSDWPAPYLALSVNLPPGTRGTGSRGRWAAWTCQSGSSFMTQSTNDGRRRKRHRKWEHRYMMSIEGSSKSRGGIEDLSTLRPVLADRVEGLGVSACWPMGSWYHPRPTNQRLVLSPSTPNLPHLLLCCRPSIDKRLWTCYVPGSARGSW